MRILVRFAQDRALCICTDDCRQGCTDEHGEAKNSWLTGTAAWNFVAVSQYILGIIPDYDGLQIDPCIPEEWAGFSVTRKFRGNEYNIAIKNPQGVSKGVVKVTVDGVRINGNILPVFREWHST